MIRVLQSVNNMHRAGLETMLMNYYRQIDRNKVQFDFLTHRPFRSEYDDEIESLGGRVYYAPRLYPQNYPAYFRFMKAFYAEHPEYRIIHSHIDSMSFLPLLAAKNAGVPVRIAHSHNTSLDRDIKYPMKECFRRLLPTVATDYLACGMDAGHYMFGTCDFEVIPNAIDPSPFRFDPTLRAKARTSLGIVDQFVIGAVGRLTSQKNISFLIHVFKELCDKRQDSLLLIIGEGEEEQRLKKLSGDLGVNDRIRFLGVRDDVNVLYQAMDILVMPSLYEGLPVVGVEAQFADLQCVFSSRITKEIKLSSKAHFISIERSYADWSNYLEELFKICRERTAEISFEKYDIHLAADNLERYYLEKDQMINNA